MNELPLRWKLFWVLCILQLVMVVYALVSNVVQLFDDRNTWRELVGLASYIFIFIYLCQGLSILNDNYPDTPLSVPQKRRFNILFVLNFLLIAFLFSKVVGAWWVVPFITQVGQLRGSLLVSLLFLIALTAFTFIFHLLFLYGMYRLRQLIHQNTVTSWYRQFDQQDPQ
jgi:hypothetical protein